MHLITAQEVAGLNPAEVTHNTYNFKKRTIFPIHSFSGTILGFGGRSFNLKAKAKYLNSPESFMELHQPDVYK